MAFNLPSLALVFKFIFDCYTTVNPRSSNDFMPTSILSGSILLRIRFQQFPQKTLARDLAVIAFVLIVLLLLPGTLIFVAWQRYIAGWVYTSVCACLRVLGPWLQL